MHIYFIRSCVYIAFYDAITNIGSILYNPTLEWCNILLNFFCTREGIKLPPPPLGTYIEGLWIILLLSLMSLTLARSEREQRLLTHANFIELVYLTL